MSEAVTKLVAQMGLETGEFEKGLARAQTSFANTVHAITNMVSGPLTAALGALGSGAAISQYIKQADAVGKMADSIGIDIEALQAWGEAAERAGGSASAFQQTVKGLNQRLQEVANGGGGEIQKTLTTIGVSATDAAGKTKDTLEVLRDLAEKSEGMDKQKFTGLAQKLGIDHGTIMLLQSGKLALDDLIKRQKALGVYTKEDAEIAAKANDAMADLQQVLKSFAAILARVIVPGITFLTEKLTTAVTYIKDHKEFVITAVVAIATAISVSMVPALVRMATAAWAAVAPFTPFILAGLALAAVIDDLCVYMEGGESALSGFWSIFGTGPEIAEDLSAAWEDLKEVGVLMFNAFIEGVRQFVDNFSLAFTGLGQMIKGVLQLIKGLFKGDMDLVVKGIENLFVGLCNTLNGLFLGVITTIYNAFVNGLINPILGLFGATWNDVTNGLVSAFDSAKNTVLNMFEGIVNTIKGWIKGLTDMIPSMDGIKKTASDTWGSVKGFFSWGDKPKEQPKTPETGGKLTPALPKMGVPIAPAAGTTASSGALPAATVNNDNKTTIKNEYTQQLSVAKIEVTAPDAQAAAQGVQTELQSNGAKAFKTDTGTRQ